MSKANLSRDEAGARSRAIHVDHYQVRLDLTEARQGDQQLFGVESTVVFDCSEPETWLDFLDGEVDEVVVNDEVVEVGYADSRIALRGLRTEGPNTVRVRGRGRYSRSGQGLHRFHDPVDDQTYLYTQFEPADSRRLYPNFEQPDLKAEFRFEVLAPQGWQVLGNQPVVEVQPAAGADGQPAERHLLAPTPRVSTYLTAICAGPWHRVDAGSWPIPGGEGREIALGLLCRQGMAEFLDADDLVETTRQGLAWYHQNFGFDYPWGKYDQIFVPEYNLGAMENPGCVTFTEHYLFRSAATRAQYLGRANTVLHEMAHMWFGDLVTPAWWDDLWLKESFAEFMGAQVSVAATQYQEAWVAFGGRRKNWAYAQDQLPTTHPIVADITDLESASQNFDGITYAKGAAVLRQLVAHVGLDAFLAGVRTYFAEHAYGSARLADLLAALEQSSGRDLAGWANAWLLTAGPDELVAEMQVANKVITRLQVSQVSVDARTGHDAARPHTLMVGLYRLDGDRLVRDQLLPLELDGRARVDLPEAVGLPEPALVLVNDTDLTYAKVGLDAVSRRTVQEHLGGLSDPLARVLVWSSLWNMTRDATFSVRDYVRAVLAHGPSEDDSSTLADLLQNSWYATTHYLPDERKATLRQEASPLMLAALRSAEPGGDSQLVWARAVAREAMDDALLADFAADQFGDQTRLPGLALGQDLRWAFVRALAAQDRLDDADLAAEVELDPSAMGRVEALAAATGRPSAQVKAEAWARVHEPRANSNDEVDALIDGLTTPGQQHLLEPLQEGWFDTLTQTWQDHAQEIAQRLVRGLFPAGDWAVAEADRWLADNPEAPAALRRLVVEGQDTARRAQRARQFNDR